MSATLLHHPLGHGDVHGSASHHRPHGFLALLREKIALWRERSRTRTHLAELDDHMLRDIGLSHELAEHEYRKPFWRG